MILYCWCDGMKKELLAIGIIMLLTTSIAIVNAYDVTNEEAKADFSGLPVSDNSIEYWGICLAGYDEGMWPYAEMIKYVLCTHGLQEDHVKLLINATKDNLFDTLSWINENADENDIVLLWLFSHGSIGLFGLYGESLYYSELDEQLDLLVVDKIGVYIFACYSGSAIPELNQSGRIIITNGRDDEQTGTIEDYCICALQGFGGFLGDDDYKVSLEEMYTFVMQHQDQLNNFHPQIADNILGELNVSIIDISDKNPDQFQNLFYNTPATINKDIGRTQSFKPTTNKINKVTLFLGKQGHPGPLNISIRQELNGEDLTSVQISEDHVLPWEQPWIAYDFYFPAINVNPGDEYYIVCETNELSDLYNQYLISMSSHDEFDAYENGSSFDHYSDGTWYEYTNSDLCFATFSFGNSPPNASFSYTPLNPTTNDTIQFTDQSYDTDGTISSWSWNFGDWRNSSEKNPTHSYTMAGNYIVNLTVTDDDGASDTETKVITVIELATITGTVKDADGNPISGVTITLSIPGTLPLPTTTTTNTNGEYTISEIATGTYDIEASKSGYDNNKNTNKIIYSGENTVNFVLTASPSGNEGTPGFELILIVCAIAFVLFWKRNRIK